MNSETIVSDCTTSLGTSYWDWLCKRKDADLPPDTDDCDGSNDGGSTSEKLGDEAPAMGTFQVVCENANGVTAEQVHEGADGPYTHTETIYIDGELMEDSSSVPDETEDLVVDSHDGNSLNSDKIDDVATLVEDLRVTRSGRKRAEICTNRHELRRSCVKYTGYVSNEDEDSDNSLDVEDLDDDVNSSRISRRSSQDIFGDVERSDKNVLRGKPLMQNRSVDYRKVHDQKTEDELVEKIAHDTKKRFVCRSCFKGFSYRKCLKNHYESQHPDSLNGPDEERLLRRVNTTRRRKRHSSDDEDVDVVVSNDLPENEENKSLSEKNSRIYVREENKSLSEKNTRIYVREENKSLSEKNTRTYVRERRVLPPPTTVGNDHQSTSTIPTTEPILPKPEVAISMQTALVQSPRRIMSNSQPISTLAAKSDQLLASVDESSRIVVVSDTTPNANLDSEPCANLDDSIVVTYPSNELVIDDGACLMMDNDFTIPFVCNEIVIETTGTEEVVVSPQEENVTPAAVVNLPADNKTVCRQPVVCLERLDENIVKRFCENARVKANSIMVSKANIPTMIPKANNTTVVPKPDNTTISKVNSATVLKAKISTVSEANGTTVSKVISTTVSNVNVTTVSNVNVTTVSEVKSTTVSKADSATIQKMAGHKRPFTLLGRRKVVRPTNPQRKFKCNVCGQRFNRSCHLNVHTLEHKKKPYFQCNYCERKFYKTMFYETHLTICKVMKMQSANGKNIMESGTHSKELVVQKSVESRFAESNVSTAGQIGVTKAEKIAARQVESGVELTTRSEETPQTLSKRSGSAKLPKRLKLDVDEATNEIANKEKVADGTSLVSGVSNPCLVESCSTSTATDDDGTVRKSRRRGAVSDNGYYFLMQHGRTQGQRQHKRTYGRRPHYAGRKDKLLVKKRRKNKLKFTVRKVRVSESAQLKKKRLVNNKDVEGTEIPPKTVGRNEILPPKIERNVDTSTNAFQATTESVTQQVVTVSEIPERNFDTFPNTFQPVTENAVKQQVVTASKIPERNFDTSPNTFQPVTENAVKQQVVTAIKIPERNFDTSPNTFQPVTENSVMQQVVTASEKIPGRNSDTSPNTFKPVTENAVTQQVVTASEKIPGRNSDTSPNTFQPVTENAVSQQVVTASEILMKEVDGNMTVSASVSKPMPKCADVQEGADKCQIPMIEVDENVAVSQPTPGYADVQKVPNESEASRTEAVEPVESSASFPQLTAQFVADVDQGALLGDGDACIYVASSDIDIDNEVIFTDPGEMVEIGGQPETGEIGGQPEIGEIGGQPETGEIGGQPETTEIGVKPERIVEHKEAEAPEVVEDSLAANYPVMNANIGAAFTPVDMKDVTSELTNEHIVAVDSAPSACPSSCPPISSCQQTSALPTTSQSSSALPLAVRPSSASSPTRQSGSSSPPATSQQSPALPPTEQSETMSSPTRRKSETTGYYSWLNGSSFTKRSRKSSSSAGSTAETKRASPARVKEKVVELYCNVCNKQFSYLTNLKIHLKEVHFLSLKLQTAAEKEIVEDTSLPARENVVYHNKKASQSRVAQNVSTSHIEHNDHSRKKRREVVHSCPVPECLREFTNLGNYKMHLKRHRRDGTLPAILRVPLAKVAVDHKSTTRGATATCSSATKLQTGTSNDAHRANSKPLYTCKTCSKSFDKRRSLQTHETFTHHRNDKSAEVAPRLNHQNDVTDSKKAHVKPDSKVGFGKSPVKKTTNVAKNGGGLVTKPVSAGLNKLVKMEAEGIKSVKALHLNKTGKVDVERSVVKSSSAARPHHQQHRRADSDVKLKRETSIHRHLKHDKSERPRYEEQKGVMRTNSEERGSEHKNGKRPWTNTAGHVHTSETATKRHHQRPPLLFPKKKKRVVRVINGVPMFDSDDDDDLPPPRKETPAKEERKFYCKLCSQQFRFYCSWRQHISSKHGTQTVCCPLCFKWQHLTTNSLDDHLTNHFKNFANNTTVVQHLVEQLIDKNPLPRLEKLGIHFCGWCSSAFDSRVALKKHKMRERLTKPHQCAKCERRFSDVRQLDTHMNSHKTTKHRCKWCEKVFSDVAELEFHEKHHAKEFKCDMCSKQFKSVGFLKRHQQKHCTAKAEPTVPAARNDRNPNPDPTTTATTTTATIAHRTSNLFDVFGQELQAMRSNAVVAAPSSSSSTSSVVVIVGGAAAASRLVVINNRGAVQCVGGENVLNRNRVVTNADELNRSSRSALS